MIDNKALEGMRKASPEKRYKNFLNTVTDLEKVWLLSSKDGCVTFDVDGFVHVMLWPRKEFCEFLMTPEEIPISMEIHDFLAVVHYASFVCIKHKLADSDFLVCGNLCPS